MKKLLFVQSRAPHGSLFGQEGLDAILMGSAFAQCSVLLLEDGVYQLVSDQDSRELGTKDYSVTYGALADYGVNDLFCSAVDLERRGLAAADLTVPVTVLDDAAIADLLQQHDVVFSF